MQGADAGQSRKTMKTRWPLPIWLLGWTLAMSVLCAKFALPTLQLRLHGPDNAMWLVSARDVLSGQGLWDSIQHRLNPPEGAPMHWARWLSLLIAAPIGLLSLFLGDRSAEIAVAFLWPAVWLAVFMALI